MLRSTSVWRTLRSPSSSVDEGWAFVVLVFVSVCFFADYFIVYSFGVLYTALLDVYSAQSGIHNASSNVTNSSTPDSCSYGDGQDLSGPAAWSFTLHIMSLGIWSPLAVYLSHRWSNRIVIAIGGFCYSLGSPTCAFTTSAWQAVLLYGGIAGFGMAFLYAPLFSLLPCYFEKHLTLACGIVGAAIHLGPVAGAPVSQLVIDRFGMEGIAALYGVLGILMIFSAIFLRPSSRYTKKREGRDDDDEKSELKKFVTMFTFFKTHPRVVVWVFVSVVAYALLYVASVHLVRYAECTLQAGGEASSLLLTYMWVSTTVACVIVGVIFNRVKVRRPVFIQMGLMLCGGLFAMGFPLYTSYGLSVIFVVGYGFSIAMNSLYPIVAASLVGPELSDHAVGLLVLFTGSLSPCSAPIAGWMYDSFGDYRYSFLTMGCAVVFFALMEILIEIYAGRSEHTMSTRETNATAPCKRDPFSTLSYEMSY